jgi:hypothetical protein
LSTRYSALALALGLAGPANRIANVGSEVDEAPWLERTRYASVHKRGCDVYR